MPERKDAHGLIEALSGVPMIVAILLVTLALGIYGSRRSLWLDEAWVANAVRQPELSTMFQYPDWVQTSPPLFLLIARTAVATFGLSTLVLRSVPLVLSLIAVAAMWAASRRALDPPFAALAVALLAVHPTVVEYFRSFKQYGGEIAATALALWAAVIYLKHPQERAYWRLLAAIVLLLPLSYPLAMLAPGLAIAVYQTGGMRRASGLVTAAAAMLGILYVAFIRQNLSPALFVYWKFGQPEGLSAGEVLTLAFGLAIAVRLALAALRGAGWGWRERLQLICLIPGAILLAAEALEWYPVSPRTRLFVRPCLLLLLAINLEDALGWMAQRWRSAPVERIGRAAVAVFAAVFLAWGTWKQFAEQRQEPWEDYAGAVPALRAAAAPGDLILIHPSAREGFRLYAAIEGWQDPPVEYGATGWPCCPRTADAAPLSSDAGAVERDVARMVPAGYTGSVWLLYTLRDLHWAYTGLDEGELWRKTLWDRGCPPGPYIEFWGLVVTSMVCEQPARPAGREADAVAR